MLPDEQLNYAPSQHSKDNMQTIKELREITQKEKIEGRERPWFYTSLQRGPSIYITRILINTSVSPNTISVFSILSGVIGSMLLVTPTQTTFILGILLCYLHILLDKVDGEIARYKKQFSLRGVFLDEINHLVVPTLFFVGMTFHLLLYVSLEPRTLFFVLISGIAAAIAVSLIRTGWSLAPQIFAKKYIKRQDLFIFDEKEVPSPITKIKRNHLILTQVLGWIHQFQDFLLVLLVFFLGTLAELIFSVSLLQYILMAYGIFLPLVFIENTIKGYFSVESRVQDLRDRFLQ